MKGRNPWSGLTQERLTYALKLLIVIVLALYLGQFVLTALGHVRTVLYVLVGAVFFSYLIHPFVARLQKRMPLGAAILVVYAALALVVGIAMWLIVPRVMDESAAFVQHYPEFASRVNAFVNDPNDPIASRLPPWVRAEIARVPAEAATWVKVHGAEAAGHVMVVLAGTFAIVTTFVIIPLIAAYLLLDLDNLRQGLAAMIPPQRWKATLDLLAEFDAVVGGFIRGQLVVALSVGVLVTIALLLLHVRYAFVLGLIAAIGDLIPYVGAVLAFIPAFGSAVSSNGWMSGVFVLVAFVLIFELEGHILAPNIVSKTVKLSPLIVLLALLIGAELGGLVGMLVAVPVAGILRVLALRVFRPPGANEAPP